MPNQFGIRFESVRKTFGSETIIPSLDLNIISGERLVLLGPSGCGKTTIMRLIAGLEQPVSGNIYMGDTKVNDMDASERNVSMVFQNYALYPHMTVFDNMAFSLKLRKVPKTEISRRIEEIAGKLELGSLLKRKPRELSGGQRQRVALGRAIAQESPYFLLDEPLSNLDAQLRTSARNELVELHETYPTTMVYVTHDQVEAMTIGQRIAVLRKGQVQQIGSPDDIYNRPANKFVASFIGNPPMNVMSTQITDNGLLLAGQDIYLPEGMRAELARQSAGQVVLGIRPEALTLQTGAEQRLSGISVKCEYLRTEYLGAQYVHHVAVEQHRLLFTTASPLRVSPHSNVTLTALFEGIHFFDTEEMQQRIQIPWPERAQHKTPIAEPILSLSKRF